jgi:hypothetical protein
MRDPVRTIYEKSGDRSYLPRHSMSGLTIPLRLFSWHRQLNTFTCPSRCLGPEWATHFQELRPVAE